MLDVMIDSATVDAVKNIIEKNRRFVILVHRNPDGDAIGSSLALMLYLRSLGKSADVIVPNSFPDFLKWMTAVEDIKNYETQKEEADVQLSNAEAIFCLDFNSMSRVAEIAKVITTLDVPRILIDHHLFPDSDFSVLISFPEACSTAELVYRLLSSLENDKTLTREIAECIYTGIMTDTGNFAYASNRKEIYMIIARLIEAGIDKDLIYRKVFYSYSIDRLRLFGYVMYNKLRLFPEYNAALMTLSNKEIRRFNAMKGDTEGLVNMPLQIKGVRFSCFLREEQRGKINVSLRSVDDFPCNRVAADFFGGGGHKNASGGEVRDSMEAAVALFNKALEKYKNELVE